MFSEFQFCKSIFWRLRYFLPPPFPQRSQFISWPVSPYHLACALSINSVSPYHLAFRILSSCLPASRSIDTCDPVRLPSNHYLICFSSPYRMTPFFYSLSYQMTVARKIHTRWNSSCYPQLSLFLRDLLFHLLGCANFLVHGI